ncbi:MAG: phosphatidylglycerophosphatase A [Syntrophales bacterium]
MSESIIKFIATGFGSGYAPYAPGTSGTLTAIPVYLILSLFPQPAYLFTTIALSLTAVYVSSRAEEIFREKDSSKIVIDEIVGFLFAMLLVKPSILNILLGFILFRFFDIIKIFPARFCERVFPGGIGVVADDVIAGIYTNFILVILGHTGII